jgi:hypothetical protein
MLPLYIEPLQARLLARKQLYQYIWLSRYRLHARLSKQSAHLYWKIESTLIQHFWGKQMFISIWRLQLTNRKYDFSLAGWTFTAALYLFPAQASISSLLPTMALAFQSSLRSVQSFPFRLNKPFHRLFCPYNVYPQTSFQSFLPLHG